MLPKKNRLQKKKDFEKVFANGKGFRQDLLFLKAAKSGLETFRFGIIVSKKISKSAVKRNRVKRQLREIIRRQLQNCLLFENEQGNRGMDVVLISLPGIEARTYQETEAMAIKLFEKAGIIA